MIFCKMCSICMWCDWDTTFIFLHKLGMHHPFPPSQGNLVCNIMDGWVYYMMCNCISHDVDLGDMMLHSIAWQSYLIELGHHYVFLHVIWMPLPFSWALWWYHIPFKWHRHVTSTLFHDMGFWSQSWVQWECHLQLLEHCKDSTSTLKGMVHIIAWQSLLSEFGLHHISFEWNWDSTSIFLDTVSVTLSTLNGMGIKHPPSMPTTTVFWHCEVSKPTFECDWHVIYILLNKMGFQSHSWMEWGCHSHHLWHCKDSTST